MAFSVLLMLTLLMLSIPFSSCAPQDSATTAGLEARIFYADTCTLNQKIALDKLLHDSEEIFASQSSVSFLAMEPTRFEASGFFVSISRLRLRYLRVFTEFEDEQWWHPGKQYQPAMDMYLGIDSIDTTRRIALGWGSYQSTIQGGILDRQVPHDGQRFTHSYDRQFSAG